MAGHGRDAKTVHHNCLFLEVYWVFYHHLCGGDGEYSQSIHEAAAIDGTNKWQHFWLIVFPLIKPTTLLVSVMAMLQCLKTFSTQYLFTTSGAPTKPINVITLNIYNTAIRDFRIDRASAMSVLLS